MNDYFIKRPLPQWWLTALFMALNCVWFVLAWINGVDPLQPTLGQLIHWGADFAPLTLGAQNWRLFSSLFLHIGVVHLLVNLWALYLFGLYAEFYYGRRWYVLIYITAGVAGNLLSNGLILQQTALQAQKQLLLQAAPFVPSISAGASGCIMGLGAALLVAALWPKPGLAAHEHLNKNALLVLMLLNLGIGLIIPGINNAAHAGGFMAGALLALLYRISLTVAIRWQGWLQAATWLISMALLFWANAWLMHQARFLEPVWNRFY